MRSPIRIHLEGNGKLVGRPRDLGQLATTECPIRKAGDAFIYTDRQILEVTRHRCPPQSRTNVLKIENQNSWK